MVEYSVYRVENAYELDAAEAAKVRAGKGVAPKQRNMVVNCSDCGCTCGCCCGCKENDVCE